MANLSMPGIQHVATKYVEAGSILVDIEPMQACAGKECPCSKVKVALPNLLQSAAETRSFDSVAAQHPMYSKMFIKLAAPLMRAGHVHWAALSAAEAYYRLIANPMYNSRTALNTWDFSAAAEHQELAVVLGEQLMDSDLMPLLARTAAALSKQWLSINKKLQKAYGALPTGQQHFSEANAATLQAWLDNGIASKLSTALPDSHILFLWTASLCRVWPNSIFAATGAQQLLRHAAPTVAEFLQAVASMGLLAAAGVSVSSQPPAAAAAAALDLAGLLVADVGEIVHKSTQGVLKSAAEARMAGQPRRQEHQPVTLPAVVVALLQNQPQLLFLSNTVMCCYGMQLFQHLAASSKNELLRQASPASSRSSSSGSSGCSSHAAGGGSATAPSGHTSNSSSSSRASTGTHLRPKTTWEIADGVLLVGADSLTPFSATATAASRQQQLQHRAARAEHLLKQFQQQWQQLGFAAHLPSTMLQSLRQILHQDYGAQKYSSSTAGSNSEDTGVGRYSSSSFRTWTPADCAKSACAAGVLQYAVLHPAAKVLADSSLAQALQPTKQVAADVVCRQLLTAPLQMLSVLAAEEQLSGAAGVPKVQEWKMYADELLLQWDLAAKHLPVLSNSSADAAGATPSTVPGEQQGAGQDAPGRNEQQQQQEPAVMPAGLEVLGQLTYLLQELLLLQQPVTLPQRQQEQGQDREDSNPWDAVEAAVRQAFGAAGITAAADVPAALASRPDLSAAAGAAAAEAYKAAEGSKALGSLVNRVFQALDRQLGSVWEWLDEARRSLSASNVIRHYAQTARLVQVAEAAVRFLLQSDAVPVGVSCTWQAGTAASSSSSTIGSGSSSGSEAAQAAENRERLAALKQQLAQGEHRQLVSQAWSLLLHAQAVFDVLGYVAGRLDPEQVWPLECRAGQQLFQSIVSMRFMLVKASQGNVRVCLQPSEFSHVLERLSGSVRISAADVGIQTSSQLLALCQAAEVTSSFAAAATAAGWDLGSDADAVSGSSTDSLPLTPQHSQGGATQQAAVSLLPAPAAWLLTLAGKYLHSVGQELVQLTQAGSAAEAAMWLFEGSGSAAGRKGSSQLEAFGQIWAAVLELSGLSDPIRVAGVATPGSGAHSSDGSGSSASGSCSTPDSCSSSNAGSPDSHSSSSSSTGLLEQQEEEQQEEQQHEEQQQQGNLQPRASWPTFACFGDLDAMINELAPSLTSAAAELNSTPQSPREAIAVSAVGSILQHFGAELCTALPSSMCCNNPACSNLGTVSESFALVRGRACVCAGCIGVSTGGVPVREGVPTARYCSTGCQAAHRLQHERVCRGLRAA